MRTQEIRYDDTGELCAISADTRSAHIPFDFDVVWDHIKLIIDERDKLKLQYTDGLGKGHVVEMPIVRLGERNPGDEILVETNERDDLGQHRWRLATVLVS